MRSVLAVVVLLSVVWLQPSASADGCRIDLSEPTRPEVYGDCIGLTHGVHQSEESLSIEAGVRSDVGVADPTGVLCSSRTCHVGIDQGVNAEFDPEDPTSSPGLWVTSGARLNESDEGHCMVEPKEQIGNVGIVGCAPAP